MSAERDVTLAFAGVFQAAALAHQLARADEYDWHALHESTYSLLRLEAGSIAEIFNAPRGLRLGLNCLANLLAGRRDASTPEVLQYALGCHRLSLQLRGSRRELALIGECLAQMRAGYMKYYDEPLADNALHNNLATLYNRSIARLKSRIIVRGRKTRLEDRDTIHRIRAALFAGIRAAWLWRQLGGRRHRLLFQLGMYRRETQRLLAEARL
ncbi:MAG: DUF489 family protein [Gammaproteobacteria bacterium]